MFLRLFKLKEEEEPPRFVMFFSFAVALWAVAPVEVLQAARHRLNKKKPLHERFDQEGAFRRCLRSRWLFRSFRFPTL